LSLVSRRILLVQLHVFLLHFLNVTLSMMWRKLPAIAPQHKRPGWCRTALGAGWVLGDRRSGTQIRDASVRSLYWSAVRPAPMPGSAWHARKRRESCGDRHAVPTLVAMPKPDPPLAARSGWKRVSSNRQA